MTRSPKHTAKEAQFDHEGWLAAALIDLKVNPYDLLWHYLWAAFLRHGAVSTTAEYLNVQRRTVQRVLDQKRK